MEKLTYRQAFDKITEAYIKGEINPYDNRFCFCGTLCDGNRGWAKDSYAAVYYNEPHNDFGYYSGVEYMRMEQALINSIHGYCNPNKEEAIFRGMCAALEVLKQIHKERGENVEDFQFTKRQLKTCI